MAELRIDVPDELARALTIEAQLRGCDPAEALLGIAAEYFSSDPRGKDAAWSTAMLSAIELPNGADAEEMLLGTWLDEVTKEMDEAPPAGGDTEEAFKRWLAEYQLGEMDEI